MRAACTAAARVLQDLSSLVVPGVSTAGLDAAARGLMTRHGCESACHGYVVGRLTYPGYVCISVNDEIVHGIGAPDRIIRDGDLVSLDVVVRREGFIGDNARTIVVGKAPAEAVALCRDTENALHAGIAAVKPGSRVGDISAAIQAALTPRGTASSVTSLAMASGARCMKSPKSLISARQELDLNCWLVWL